MFHERILYTVLDVKVGIRPQQPPFATSQIAQFVLDQKEAIYQDVRKNALQNHIKYKAYFDKKAKKQRFKFQASKLCLCLSAENR